mgnify:CR=1 FL=1
MEEWIRPEKGVLYRGNLYRLKECMKKAAAGQTVTAGFIGGSITQGALASGKETCYAYLIYEWWQEKFPAARITYLNAGVGGTTSQFGVARVNEHLLKHRPDFVLAEFAVNDQNTDFYKETYEGLVRNLLTGESKPAVVLMHNVDYTNGENAQAQHHEVARAYELPSISMKESIWLELARRGSQMEDIMPDGLHPNDRGHQLIAKVIIAFLESVLAEINTAEPVPFWHKGGLRTSITKNAYQHCTWYQNQNSRAVCDGFQPDYSTSHFMQGGFYNGWTAQTLNDKIVIEVTGSEIAIQYRKTIHRPAPVAQVVLDGKEAEAIVLDGNFKEDWGDCLFLETILYHGENKKHTVDIRIIETHENDQVPFYLASVIASW